MRASLVALAFLAFCVGCGSKRTTLESLWRASGETVALVPGTSDYTPGDLRISFLVVDDRGKSIERPTADVWLARSRSDTPFARTTARMQPIGVFGSPAVGDVTGIYVVHLRIGKAGRYWLLARPVGGDVKIGGLHDIEVRSHSASPMLGSRAFPSRTPTLATEPVRALTTRVPPDRALVRYSVADSLQRHIPFVLVFATPRFCTSRTCGPVVDVVDSVRRRFARSGIRFIHVEIYADNNPTKGANRWVREWHLPTEPWTFLVGADGRIKAKFEGSVSQRELTEAVRRDLATR